VTLPPRATGLARRRGSDPHKKHRLGVMGGTFDPIHHGHLVAASEVAARFELDEVVFVPTGQPWQKTHRQVSSPEDRYLMTVIATASNPRFTVSRVDIDRPGLTYTADTLRDLRTERGDDVDMYFITGADALAQILTWREVDSQDKVTVMEVPALAISSTACRLRVQEHQPIWYLVPDGIVQYIAKRGLYQS
jgi:nicotinate-nucleotide adenylyltransferase